MKTILKNVTLLPEYGYQSERVHVTVEDRRIASISTELPDTAGCEVVEGKGNLLIPGFYNIHCHAAMTLFRGYGEDLPLDRWLNERIFPAEDRLTAKSVNVATKLAIAEMLRGGIVSFSDMYMFEDAVADAVAEYGIKANLSRSIVSFDPDIDIRADSRFTETLDLIRGYHGYDDGRIRVDLSLHAEYTNVPRACRDLADYAKEYGFGMQIHLSETEKEHRECIERH